VTLRLYTLSLHDALPISANTPGSELFEQFGFGIELQKLRAGLLAGFRETDHLRGRDYAHAMAANSRGLQKTFGQIHRAKDRDGRSEEHTSELQSRGHLVC